jgi:hypothetical protein
MIEGHQWNLNIQGPSGPEVQIDEAAVVVVDDADEGIELGDV